MTLAQLIPFAINASMFLIVFALGLAATFQDATYLLRRPSLLLRSILSMNIVMLAVAFAIVVLIDPQPVVKIALIALAVSPVPPVLPAKQEKAGGSESYTIGLLVATALVAIILVPTVIELLGMSTGRDIHQPPANVGGVVLISVIVPLIAGVLVRYFAPALATRIAHPISVAATALLAVAVVPVLVTAWPALWALVGNGMVVALAVFTLIGIAVGHLLGGPHPEDRTVLALASGTRHPGVAIAIASLNFPEEKAALVVMLSHLIIGAIVSVPYVKWRTHTHAAQI
ncbi:Na+-dependent transporter [Pseudaminobacter arsenicus]|uniref:Na+-dependent transporter n=1 Tax=Borborobacter arsenicus TaxID=1851146 RepID=A0A432V0L7_9HYPH|nr:Na+-dependent transporter [Pseudaminobacter arsenicus]RUM95754.1 Na+-dependent transporter [Pseudaminobacter arsenicus]